MKRTLIICSLIFSCLMLNAQNAGPKISTFRIEDPEILSNSHIELDTEWDFFWGKFVPPYDKTATPDLQVSVPSDWNKYPLDDDIKAICKTGRGSGTYRLLVTNLKPETSYTFPTFEMGYTAFSVYANNKMIFLAGVPSEEWENTYADQPFENAVFTTDKNGSVLLTVFISGLYFTVQ